MTWATLDGSRVIKGSVTIPFFGAWVADVLLAEGETVPARSTLVLGDLTLSGTAFRSASFTGSRGVRLVGGAGGWRKSVVARAYQNPAGVPLSMALQDAAIEVGETVRLASDETLGTFYVREAGPASRVLRQLAGPLWWIDPAGVTQIAPTRATGAIKSAFTVIKFSGAEGRFQIATEVLADWMPNRSFSSPTVTHPKTIASVTHTITNDGKARLEVLTA